MFKKSKLNGIRLFLALAAFIAFFLYFFLLNRYHILYLEQEQLFRFSSDYLKEFLSLPGSLPLLSGTFFTQFFISPVAGSFIITAAAALLFFMSRRIAGKPGNINLILSMLPVCLIAMLHSSEIFTFGQTAGIILSWLWIVFFISTGSDRRKTVIFFSCWPLFYLLSGAFAIPAAFISALFVIISGKEKKRFILAPLMVATALLIPLAFSKFLYYLPSYQIFTYPLMTDLPDRAKYPLIIILLWPSVLILFSVLSSGKKRLPDLPDRKAGIPGLIVASALIILMGFTVYRYSWNKPAELMLAADHHVQKGEWDKVLKTAGDFPGLNTLVIYYTNLALAAKGELTGKMFSYPQFGAAGLRLRWERNNNLFFGGDVFYSLSYINEANRWAFESMVAKGLTPRSLKRLVLTAIINKEYDIASKYLRKLDQTLFYRRWAARHRELIKNPSAAEKDPEVSRHRQLLVSTDFISRSNSLNLDDLLNNHPDNRTAYEYIMATVLLDRNLEAFAEFVPRIVNYNYSSLPRYIEEALIFYNSYEGKNIMPEGYSFSPDVVKRFGEYATVYSKYRQDRGVASVMLRDKYKDSYWYYLQFNNTDQ